MKMIPPKIARIHSLDSLRAIMMMLGLVLHSAITYTAIDYGAVWPLKDPIATHSSNDFVVWFIHSFRMQIFFLVAGFFGAMLFYERRVIKMVKNRVSRIVLPFFVFLLLLWPISIFALTYTKFVFAGNGNALTETFTIFGDNFPLIFIPLNTIHLWFLYYLTFVTFTTVGIALIFTRLPTVSHQISKSFRWIIQRTGVRILFFAFLSAIIYFIMGTTQVSTSASFVPVFNTFIYYLLFYIVGWILYKSNHLLEKFTKNDWLNTAMGITLFCVYRFMGEQLDYAIIIILKSIMIWLLIFGITGLFIRYCSKPSAIMRYISDSSYWVYLVHLPLTFLIPALIVDWPIPATLKAILVATISTIICFVTYHYLVRASFIGKFLNGRKYSKKLSDIKSVKTLGISQVTPVEILT